MAKATIGVRMTQNTLNVFRQYLAPLSGETMVAYFERLSKWIKEQDALERQKNGL